MWFIIALLVGIPFFIKVSSDLSKEKAFDRQHAINEATYKSNMSQWVAKVTDRKLELELEEMIYRASLAPPPWIDPANFTDIQKHDFECYKTVFRDIKKAHDEMPWLGKIRSKYEYESGVEPLMVSWDKTQTYRIRQIMMACRGKLTDNDASLGIWIGLQSGGTQISNLRGLDHMRKYVMWIDRQLKEHGVNEEMYFHEFGTAYTIDAARHRFNGTFRWAPSVPVGIKISNEKLPTTEWFPEEDDIASTAN